MFVDDIKLVRGALGSLPGLLLISYSPDSNPIEADMGHVIDLSKYLTVSSNNHNSVLNITGKFYAMT